MKEIFEERSPEPEKDAAQESGYERISEPLKSILDAHIADIESGVGGRRDIARSIEGAAVAARETVVTRSTPPLEIRSATINPGESKVLVGPNGAGKSTFFDAFMDRGAHLSGEGGAVVYGDSVHAKEKLRIARLDQEELLGKIGNLTVREVLDQAVGYFKAQFPVNWESEDPDVITKSIENQGVQARIEEFRAKVTGLFEMSDFLNTKVANLSGGEKTKTSLAIVLLSEPDVLFLDEPTNHLDLQSISKLTALFRQYNKAGVGILSASHVPWFLKDASRDGVLDIRWDQNGRVLTESKSPYERYIKDSGRKDVPLITGEIKWTQKDYHYKAGATLVEAPPQFTIPDSPLRDVSVSNIQGGSITVLSGNNGAGKTKLLEALAFGKGKQLPQKQKKVHGAYLPQFWPEEVERGTLGGFFDWIKHTATPHEKGSAEHPDSPARNLFIKRARELSFGGGTKQIGEAWLREPFQRFSGGEQRFLWFLATSTLRNLDMIVIDEPTNHMDQASQQKILRTIRQFPGAIVLATHDRDLMKALSDDSGTVQGSQRFSTHLVLEKRDGKTSIRQTDESYSDYVDRIVEEARRKTKNIQV